MTSPTKTLPLSVVMPVHNALPHLDEAVRSILAQSWSDFEFVIFDDGSTDGSTERLREWAGRDSRIKLIESAENLGPAASSNRVVELSSAPLVARMDADDVSHPERLKNQLELLEQRPELGLVGTMHETIDAEGRIIRGANYWRLLQKSWFVPFPHGSIMYRREIFDRIGGYREECVFWEDQDFFLRASAITRIVTIPAALYQHRHSPVSTRLASDQDRVEHSVDLMYRAVQKLEAKQSYDQLLQAQKGAERSKVDPRVFISLGSLVLWGGGRPRYLGRLLSRGRLSLNAASLSALTWTGWALLSPSTLRGFMRLLAGVRNGKGNWTARSQQAIEWRTRFDLQPHQLRQGPAGGRDQQ